MGKTEQAAGGVAYARPGTDDGKFNAVIRFKMFPKSGQPEKEDGFTIAKALTDRGREVMLKGSFGPVRQGQSICVLKSVEKHDPKFGPFIQVLAIEMKDPETVADIHSYLVDQFGVSGEFARAITGRFGKDTIKKIDRNPELLGEIEGFATEAETLQGEWLEKRVTKRNIQFLTRTGFSQRAANKIAAHMGRVNVQELWKSNPYIVSYVEDVKFGLVDRIALKNGVAVDDPRRISAGMADILSRSEQAGHICLTRNDIHVRASHVLKANVSEDMVETGINQMLEEGQLVSETRDGTERIYTAELHRIETRLFSSLAERLNRDTVDPGVLIPSSDSNVTDKQFEAARRAFSYPISLLTGSAGCGKTTALKEILAQAEKRGQTVTCLAPTGKAAKRMTEATGREASTIHRALGKEGMLTPKSLEDSDDVIKINSDVVIVDEASMLDMRVAERLISGMGPKSHLVLVGDPNQLPPVGAGSVLLDLIESDKTPSTHLTQVFRQAQGSLLVLNANRIKDGKEPFWNADEASRETGVDVVDDWEFIDEKDPSRVIQKTVEKIQELSSDGTAKDEILVTSPTRRAEVGTYRLNRKLQEVMNPGAERVRGPLEQGEPGLLKGDRVMNTKNQYKGHAISHDIMNGDTGEITGFNSDSGEATVDFGFDQPVTLKKWQLDDVIPSYAATTHKLQGSEAPVVICPLAGAGNEKLLSRNLIYTAWTRGKQKCVVIGDKSKLAVAAATDGAARNTTLDLKVSDLSRTSEAKWEKSLKAEQKCRAEHEARITDSGMDGLAALLYA